MPETKLQVLQLRPGVNREGTSYAGEGIMTIDRETSTAIINKN